MKIGLLDNGARHVARHRSADERARSRRSRFLPFGLLIDQWRWKVFAGEITPAQYNKAWWDLRLKYQGVAPPSARGEEFFDPGAKYHVPDNTPYTRYFLADILQFQFHRALAKAAGCDAAAAPLLDLREQGGRRAARTRCCRWAPSRPWPDALEALTGIEADGRDRDPRLLRAAVEVAGRAARGTAGGMVTAPAATLRCQRCGSRWRCGIPPPGAPWKPDQFWVCPRCGRHFWTTYPAATGAPGRVHRLNRPENGRNGAVR